MTELEFTMLLEGIWERDREREEFWVRYYNDAVLHVWIWELRYENEYLDFYGL